MNLKEGEEIKKRKKKEIKKNKKRKKEKEKRRIPNWNNILNKQNG